MSKKTLATIAATLAVVGLAFALNPSPEKHRETIKTAVAERSPLQAVLGVGVLTAFVSHYHSIGVASYTKVDDKIVTIGAFGVVVLID